MPVENQSQVAKEAVGSVIAEAAKTRREARTQRAADRAASWAQQQPTAEQGLRALAFGEREGVRKTKEWTRRQLRRILLWN